MVKQVPLSELFNRREILYLQGCVARRSLTEINNQISCTASKVRKSLGRFFTVQDGDKIEMPLMLVIYSPFYNAVAYQGEETYPLLRLCDQLHLRPPPPQLFSKVSREIVDMVNGFPPESQPYLVEAGLWDKNLGLSLKTKRRLNLRQEEVQFNYNVGGAI